jgi:hypothetical protein
MRHKISFILAVLATICSALVTEAKVTKKERRLIERMQQFDNHYCSAPSEKLAAHCALLKGEIQHTQDIIMQLDSGATDTHMVHAQVKQLKVVADKIRKQKAKEQTAQLKAQKQMQALKLSALKKAPATTLTLEKTQTKVGKRQSANATPVKIKLHWAVNSANATTATKSKKGF